MPRQKSSRFSNKYAHSKDPSSIVQDIISLRRNRKNNIPDKYTTIPHRKSNIVGKVFIILILNFEKHRLTNLRQSFLVCGAWKTDT